MPLFRQGDIDLRRDDAARDPAAAHPDHVRRAAARTPLALTRRDYATTLTPPCRRSANVSVEIHVAAGENHPCLAGVEGSKLLREQRRYAYCRAGFGG
jgi:hypothetical protein